MKNVYPINMDAFSDGQISSKLWLCQELEKALNFATITNTWIYGSWYGLLPFLLLSRERLTFNNIHLFEIDPEALNLSRKFLDHWMFSQNIKIHFHLHDCNNIDTSLAKPELLINTSVEHFHNYEWWDPVPNGIWYALQSTDMIHPEHINRIETVDDFQKKLQLKSPPLFSQSRSFEYPGFQFKRFMLIGQR